MFKFGYLLAAALMLSFTFGAQSSNIYENAKAHVVLVHIGETALCSGVAISEDTVLTAAHCTERGVDNLTVVAAPGGDKMPAEVLWASGEKYELALLKVPGAHFNPATIRFWPLELGEAVFAIGHPYGIEWTLSQGYVSALHRDMKELSEGQVTTADEVQADLSIYPGNSGGGLFDTSGNLVGITNMSRSNADRLGFAVPMRVLRTLVPAL